MGEQSSENRPLNVIAKSVSKLEKSVKFLDDKLREIDLALKGLDKSDQDRIAKVVDLLAETDAKVQKNQKDLQNSKSKLQAHEKRLADVMSEEDAIEAISSCRVESKERIDGVINVVQSALSQIKELQDWQSRESISFDNMSDSLDLLKADAKALAADSRSRDDLLSMFKNDNVEHVAALNQAISNLDDEVKLLKNELKSQCQNLMQSVDRSTSLASINLNKEQKKRELLEQDLKQQVEELKNEMNRSLVAVCQDVKSLHDMVYKANESLQSKKIDDFMSQVSFNANQIAKINDRISKLPGAK
jgi:chromosome segregation ATPase